MALILSCHLNVVHKTNAAKFKSYVNHPELSFFIISHKQRVALFLGFALKKYNGKGVNEFYGTTIKDPKIKRHLRTQK